MSHILAAVDIGGTVIGGITSHSPSLETQILAEAQSGLVAPDFANVVSQQANHSFTSQDIPAALAAVGQLGVDVEGLTGGVKFYLQQLADGATRTAGATHRALTYNDGILIPQRLTCTHQGHAELTCQLIGCYDGSNDPIVISDTVALPSSVANNIKHTLGVTTLCGVTLTRKTDIEIDFGLTVEPESADSDVWSSVVSVRSQAPTIKYTGLDATWFSAANIPLLGKASTQANTIIYLRKREAGASFVSDITAEHVKIEAAGWAHVEDPGGVQGHDPAKVTVVLTVTDDGTNDVLKITTAIAIP